MQVWRGGALPQVAYRTRLYDASLVFAAVSNMADRSGLRAVWSAEFAGRRVSPSVHWVLRSTSHCCASRRRVASAFAVVVGRCGLARAALPSVLGEATTMALALAPAPSAVRGGPSCRTEAVKAPVAGGPTAHAAGGG